MKPNPTGVQLGSWSLHDRDRKVDLKLTYLRDEVNLLTWMFPKIGVRKMDGL